MFRHPAWAIGGTNSGPPAAGTVGTKSTGGFYPLSLSSNLLTLLVWKSVAGGKMIFSMGNLWAAVMSNLLNSPHVAGFSVPELQLYTGMEFGFVLLLYFSAVLYATAHIMLMTVSTGIMSHVAAGSAFIALDKTPLFQF